MNTANISVCKNQCSGGDYICPNCGTHVPFGAVHLCGHAASSGHYHKQFEEIQRDLRRIIDLLEMLAGVRR